MNKETKLSDFSVAVYAGLLDRINPEKRNPILEILNKRSQLGVLLNKQWKTEHNAETKDLEELVFDSASKTMKDWSKQIYDEMQLSRAITVPFDRLDVSIEHLSLLISDAIDAGKVKKDIFCPSNVQNKN